MMFRSTGRCSVPPVPGDDPRKITKVLAAGRPGSLVVGRADLAASLGRGFSSGRRRLRETMLVHGGAAG